jgi:hypothetical protein
MECFVECGVKFVMVNGVYIAQIGEYIIDITPLCDDEKTRSLAYSTVHKFKLDHWKSKEK